MRELNEEKFNEVREASPFGSPSSIESPLDGLRHSISNVVEDDNMNQDGARMHPKKSATVGDFHMRL